MFASSLIDISINEWRRRESRFASTTWENRPAALDRETVAAESAPRPGRRSGGHRQALAALFSLLIGFGHG